MTISPGNRQGFTGIELLVLVLMVSLIGGMGYVVWQNRTPMPSSTLPTTTPANPKVTPEPGWNLYTNEYLEGTIHYPVEWTPPTNPPGGLGYIFSSPQFKTDIIGNPIDSAYIRFVKIPNQENRSLQEWFDYRVSSGGGTVLSGPVYKVVAGLPAVEFEERILLWGDARTVIIVLDNKFLEFGLFSTEGDKTKSIEVFKKMLSTLQVDGSSLN
jgi:hypothetical protein